MSLLEQALAYAARGWAVFPAFGIVDGSCSCGKSGCTSPGKHPLVRSGVKEATTSADTIKQWWARHPEANIAIATGTASGLIVVDVDVSSGKPGLETLASLEAQHGPLPRSHVVRTGSGGLHIYLAAPQQTMRNSAAKVGEAIDIRAEGGYVIAPPSRHISGNTYHWESSNA